MKMVFEESGWFYCSFCTVELWWWWIFCHLGSSRQRLRVQNWLSIMHEDDDWSSEYYMLWGSNTLSNSVESCFKKNVKFQYFLQNCKTWFHWKLTVLKNNYQKILSRKKLRYLTYFYYFNARVILISFHLFSEKKMVRNRLEMSIFSWLLCVEMAFLECNLNGKILVSVSILFM
jgi:hypothetical protein